MALTLTPEDVVRRIAAGCAFDERRRRRHSVDAGRRDRASVRRAIPAPSPAKAKPPAKAAVVAVISQPAVTPGKSNATT